MTKWKLFWAGTIAVALLASACSTETADDAEPAAPDQIPITTEADLEGAVFDLEATVSEFVGDRDGGVSVLTTRNGETSTVAVGIANNEGDALTPETPFRVGSISKPFVAVMVLQLVDEGLVALDETLGTYLPETPIGAMVTIRDLLGHDSGVPNYTDQPDFFADVLADRDRSYDNEEILAYVAGVPNGTSGAFSYSNTNYILLGQLVEEVTNDELEQVLRDRISQPLGLTATTFVGRDVPTPTNLAGGWSTDVLDGDPTAAYESVASSAWAAGALVSTTADLAAFMIALFDGRLVSPDSLVEMTTVAGDGYGLGLFAADLGDGKPAYAHSGGITGYASTMGISPETGDVIVILSNNDTMIPDLLAPFILSSW